MGNTIEDNDEQFLNVLSSRHVILVVFKLILVKLTHSEKASFPNNTTDDGTEILFKLKLCSNVLAGIALIAEF